MDLVRTPMYPQRPPTSIKVLGILNLIFAGLGAIGLLLTYSMYFGGMKLSGRNPVIEMAQRSPEYMTFLGWSLVFGILGVVVLGASGVGLIRIRAWARKLAVTYSLFAMVSAIAGLVFTHQYLLAPLSGSRDPAAQLGIMTGYVGGVVGMVYPIILLIFMTRPKVVAAFAPRVPHARVI